MVSSPKKCYFHLNLNHTVRLKTKIKVTNFIPKANVFEEPFKNGVLSQVISFK